MSTERKPIEATVVSIPWGDLEVRVRRDGIEYYRWQANHCRELAGRQGNADVQAQLLKAAFEYQQLADAAPHDDRA